MKHLGLVLCTLVDIIFDIRCLTVHGLDSGRGNCKNLLKLPFKSSMIGQQL